MSDDTMTNEDETIQPRVRTMKRSTAAAASADPVLEQTFRDEAKKALGLPPDSEKDEEEEDGPEASGPAAPIHGGWTAGQQVMDATSQFAQALKLGENVQIVKFLDDQPYANYRRHWVDRMTQKGPSTRPYTCLETVGRECPLCDIADKPQAVSAFNIVLVGDDGQVLLRTWDVGARLFNVLKAYSTDPKVGPLSRGYFAVSQTGKKSTTQTNVTPIRENRLEEDYEIPPPSDEMLRKAGKYGADIVQIPKRSDLEEIANEIAEYEN